MKRTVLVLITAGTVLGIYIQSHPTTSPQMWGDEFVRAVMEEPKAGNAEKKRLTENGQALLEEMFRIQKEKNVHKIVQTKFPTTISTDTGWILSYPVHVKSTTTQGDLLEKHYVATLHLQKSPGGFIVSKMEINDPAPQGPGL